MTFSRKLLRHRYLLSSYERKTSHTLIAMTSSKTTSRSTLCIIGATLLQAVVVISTSGLTCKPEVACYPPVIQLANLSYPLRRLNVSSTCGAAGDSTPYCTLEDTARCSEYSSLNCSGQHTAELMFDWTDSNPHLPTYWQSNNTIATSGARPDTQYVDVSIAFIFPVEKCKIKQC